MGSKKLEQHVDAGNQFTGLEGAGLFHIPNAGGVDLTMLSFKGGTETGKTLTVTRVDEYGNDRERIYEKAAFAEAEVAVGGVRIPLAAKETIKVTTGGLTAAADFAVYYDD